MLKILGKSSIIIICLYFCYLTGKALWQVTLNLATYFKEKFGETYIIGPIGFYIVGIWFILCFSAIIVILFIDSYNPLAIELVKFTLTFLIVFIIYIGPLIMLGIMILLNVPIEQLTIVFAVMSFIAVTFKKGKQLVLKIYNKINDLL
ncbi:hypothetical protein [Staphylococcus epidermidis]|uniref:hypothetical protein n=1 Tax=Staphylococcus epidermidis TaxID=1282 RepID=UPI0007D8E305|nr:hypothetical protein [Staphylococcus epidermidis]OAO18305.1 hypothetical protein AXY35_11390 [Staphylococcus epidermidis]